MTTTMCRYISVAVQPSGAWRVEPAEEGSRLSWEFGAEPQSTSAKLMSVVGRLFEGQTKKALLQDLDDIARAAEGSAA